MLRTRQTVVVFAVLLTATIALSALMAGAAAAQPTQVDSCTTINESGEYELDAAFEVGNVTAVDDVNETAANETNGDVTVGNETADETAANETGVNGVAANETDAPTACLLITASDVVLEGNDVVLDGDNVTAADLAQANVTVENVTDANGADANVTAANGAAENNENSTNGNDTAVSDDVVNETALTGIDVRPGAGEQQVTNVTIRNVTVQNWYMGVSIQNASGVTLQNVDVRNNTMPGLHLEDATDTTVEAGERTTPEDEE